MSGPVSRSPQPTPSRPPSSPGPVRTVADYLRLAAPYLARHGVDSPRLDAELLLAHVLGIGRLELYTRMDQPLVPPEVEAYRQALRRRASREPVAYITGVKEFYGLVLQVGPGVLVPRPQTEFLVEQALRWLAGQGAQPAARWIALDGPGPASGDWPPARPGGGVVVDVGTGSGAVALALASRCQRAAVVGIDCSQEALAYARTNGERLGLGRQVRWVAGDGLAPVAEAAAAVVVSNPPYVPSGEVGRLAPEIARYEPRRALDGGPDGLEVARRVLEQAQRVLAPGGALLMELGGKAQVQALARWWNGGPGRLGPLRVLACLEDPVSGAVLLAAAREAAER